MKGKLKLPSTTGEGSESACRIALLPFREGRQSTTEAGDLALLDASRITVAGQRRTCTGFPP